MSLPVAILAGGLARRLLPITEHIPKILVEVAGQPFAVHQLKLLSRHGVTQAVFCLGHLGEMVPTVLGDGKRWGVEVRYVFDGPKLLGTGGGLRKALPLLGEAFFVLHGDAYLDCEYLEVERAFQASGKLGLMTVFENSDQWGDSNVAFRDGRILRYDKVHRTKEMHHIDYGLGILRAEALSGYRDNEYLDFARIYQDLLDRDQLAGFEVSRRFYEIGTPSGLEDTRRFLALKGAGG
jgi:NDP-sugar pyrophosphorylase family protein